MNNVYDSFEEAYYNALHNDINSVCVTNPRKSLVYRPNLHLYALLGEFILNLQGNNEVEALKHYTPAYARITDGEKVNGMIGERIFNYDCMFDIYMEENPDTKEKEFKCDHIISDQFVECLKKLSTDSVYNMPIYNKVFDMQSNHPAEIQNILWYFNDEKLCCTVNTNIFDIYIRFPYLSFFISNLMTIIADKLKCEVGCVIVNFGYVVKSYKEIKEKYIYKDLKLINNKIDNDTLKQVYELEELSRLQSNLIEEQVYKDKLSAIKNDYYKSICAVLLNFNTPYNFSEFIIKEFEL